MDGDTFDHPATLWKASAGKAITHIIFICTIDKQLKHKYGYSAVR